MPIIRVESPARSPWIPPPPPLALDTPIVLPDLATLEHALAGLHDLYRPRSGRR